MSLIMLHVFIVIYFLSGYLYTGSSDLPFFVMTSMEMLALILSYFLLF